MAPGCTAPYQHIAIGLESPAHFNPVASAGCVLVQVEYLWAPGSYVERDGPEQILVQGSCVVRMLSVRINKDGKAVTVEVSSACGSRYAPLHLSYARAHTDDR